MSVNKSELWVKVGNTEEKGFGLLLLRELREPQGEPTWDKTASNSGMGGILLGKRLDSTVTITCHLS